VDSGDDPAVGGMDALVGDLNDSEESSSEDDFVLTTR